MTDVRLIDYDSLLHDAFREAQRSVMRTILTRIAADGLPGEHHFYISFNTTAPGVAIAPRLLQKYPAEMTIVLQHRFWNLLVSADRFEVKLTFDSIRERLVIPFSAVRVFFDPSVPYGLQFDDPTPESRSATMAEAHRATGGEAAGGGGRPKAVPSRDAGDGDDRPTERRKPVRKPKPEIADVADISEGSKADAKAAETAAASAPPPAIQPAKPGPRLVETANDGAKVVSLDQFRKK